MKLAILGVVTAGIGVALGLPGLVGIGAFWVLIGPLMRLHAQRLKANPSVDGRTFAQGTLLWLALGVPSLLVGVLSIGIDGEHDGWRWLPLGLGAFALTLGVVSAALYLLGGAIEAIGDRGPAKTVPATLWISGVRETGTYVNSRPRLEFELRVEPDAGTGVEPYSVTKKATVPYVAMGSLKVGDGFRAKVAGPEHPTAMVIGWDQPEPAAGDATSDATGDVSARLESLDLLHREGRITDEERLAERKRILGTL